MVFTGNRSIQPPNFGATVTVVCEAEGGEEQTYQIVGVDEANASEGRISWIAPLSRALLKAREGDVVRFASPAGMREIEVVEFVPTEQQANVAWCKANEELAQFPVRP